MASEELMMMACKIKRDTGFIELKYVLYKSEAVLADAEEMQAKVISVKMWQDKLQKVADDVEVLLEEFETNALRKKLTSNFQEPIPGTEAIVELSERNADNNVDMGENNNIGDHEEHGRRNQKVNLAWSFVVTSFILELASAVFVQLSSVHKPQYALWSMLMSFVALFVCILELVYKCRKEKVTLKWRGALPWLYYPSPSYRRFANFKDFVGLVCALCGNIVTAIGFSFIQGHADNPIKVSVWPIIFSTGILFSKVLEKPESGSSIS